ncbi:MAG: hypothetical protein IPL84_14865 [Chitinophagaceae bacterium]|nr:hypothetical protein [Chitinophagaceae bacterium]
MTSIITSVFLKKFLIFFVIISFSSYTAYTQTLSQWSQLVNWDGVSHWSRYIRTFPAYQGPNALPVPTVGNGSIDSSFFIGVTGNFHFSKGDNTQNLRLYANYCVVKDIISMDIFWVPTEYYSTSHEIKEERRIYPQFYNDKQGEGELHLNTNFQLLKKWRKYIHLALRIGYRFPSGSGFGAARDVDAPGYYFDLSFGKPINHTSLTWTGMLGFYSWQIESDKNNQDDALLLGMGLEWNKNSWKIKSNIAGYWGYLKDSGDKPVVCRFNLEKKIKHFGVLLNFQQGLHDFRYSTVEAGVKYEIGKKVKH